MHASACRESELITVPAPQREGAPFMGKTLSVPSALPSRTITLMVRHEMVGRLIGKQGIKLKSLQGETGAKVSLVWFGLIDIQSRD